MEFNVGGLVDDETDSAGGLDRGEAEFLDGLLGEADDLGDLSGVLDRDVGVGEVLEDGSGLPERGIGRGVVAGVDFEGLFSGVCDDPVVEAEVFEDATAPAQGFDADAASSTHGDALLAVMLRMPPEVSLPMTTAP